MFSVFWKKLEIEEPAVLAFEKVGIKELQFQTFRKFPELKNLDLGFHRSKTNWQGSLESSNI